MRFALNPAGRILSKQSRHRLVRVFGGFRNVLESPFSLMKVLAEFWKSLDGDGAVGKHGRQE